MLVTVGCAVGVECVLIGALLAWRMEMVGW